MLADLYKSRWSGGRNEAPGRQNTGARWGLRRWRLPPLKGQACDLKRVTSSLGCRISLLEARIRSEKLLFSRATWPILRNGIPRMLSYEVKPGLIV